MPHRKKILLLAALAVLGLVLIAAVPAPSGITWLGALWANGITWLGALWASGITWLGALWTSGITWLG